MFLTKHGPFNGSTWEGICQQVFKRKYEVDGYQQMQASPGDFGIEGFTVDTGWAFQCYCPEKHYARLELYSKIRDKITQDLGKLNNYKTELSSRLGTTKICRWIFVTPEVDKNEILVHVRKKEKEILALGLPFIDSNFKVYVYDGDHFIVEINEIRTAAGEALVFDKFVPVIAELKGELEDYEKNVRRKSALRLARKTGLPNFQDRLTQLAQLTIQDFLGADGYFKLIEANSPATYIKLIRLINEYERYVIETSMLWNGSAEDLTKQIREQLEERIVHELAPEFNLTNASKVANHMTARWLAVCELDYD
jgi:hypothetical protein